MGSYRIFSCDGGGVRGIISARLTQRLENSVPGWLDKVDLFAGTSTGAIISAGLAHGLSAGDLFKIYQDRSKEIFARGGLRRVTGQIIKAKYNNNGLRRVIKDTFGDVTLGDLKKKVLISSLDIDAYDGLGRRVFKPKFFHNLDGQVASELSLKVADILMYTTAAPTFFPVYHGYVDGGLVANNPSMAALAQALDPKTLPRPSLNDIVLLSMGTGKTCTYIKGLNDDWGFVQWASVIIELIMNCGVEVADYECRQLLKSNYCRVNPYLDNDFRLDSINQIDRMVEAADSFDITKHVDWLASRF